MVKLPLLYAEGSTDPVKKSEFMKNTVYSTLDLPHSQSPKCRYQVYEDPSGFLVLEEDSWNNGGFLKKFGKSVFGNSQAALMQDHTNKYKTISEFIIAGKKEFIAVTVDFD